MANVLSCQCDCWGRSLQSGLVISSSCVRLEPGCAEICFFRDVPVLGIKVRTLVYCGSRMDPHSCLALPHDSHLVSLRGLFRHQSSIGSTQDACFTRSSWVFCALLLLQVFAFLAHKCLWPVLRHSASRRFQLPSCVMPALLSEFFDLDLMCLTCSWWRVRLCFVG